MKSILGFVVATFVILLPQFIRAMYLMPDVKPIPTARLISNLEQQLQGKPNDVQLRYALARVHSIAYAQEADQFQVLTNGLPHFGYGTRSDLPPRNLKPVHEGQKTQAAKEHLQKAIAEYRKVVAAETNHLYAQLGLGWSLDQAGDKKAALDFYRKALDLAWNKEKNQQALERGSGVTEEVARYMLELLDSKTDAKEIAKVQGYVKTMKKKGRWVTPILIPLEDHVAFSDLVNTEAAITFDLDGSGLDRQWGWITPKAGWLVYDGAGQGKITSGLQLVGSVTFWIFWQNGYQALSIFDHDGDGVLRGEELQGIALWQDKNNNGVSDPGEVRPLAAWGITALSCRSETFWTGIPFSPQGVQFKDGSTRPSYDWIVPGGSR